MGRKEAQAKAWNTFMENVYQYAKEHPEYPLRDIILQRADTAYWCWRDARLAERRGDFRMARGLYLKASESLEQAEKLAGVPVASLALEKIKAEYYEFVVSRNPVYRAILSELLPIIRAKPGILQTDLYKLVQMGRAEVSYGLYFAEKEELVRREGKGRSYLLFFIRDKAGNDLIRAIQDDEIDIQTKTQEAADFKNGCKFILTFFFWVCALVGFGAAGGLFGVSFIVVAFIAWRIIKKNSAFNKVPIRNIPHGTRSHSKPV
jgi:hypothetical protein